MSKIRCLSIGYMFSGWFNVVKPSNYIRSVQANDDHPLEGPGNNFLGFSGLFFGSSD